VVEDSLTTRTLMKSILEAAGYEVFVAGTEPKTPCALHSRR